MLLATNQKFLLRLAGATLLYCLSACGETSSRPHLAANTQDSDAPTDETWFLSWLRGIVSTGGGGGGGGSGSDEPGGAE